MNKLIAIALLGLSSLALRAQTNCDDFRANLYNSDYQLLLHIDFCDESITIPGQDLYGQVPGYVGKKNNDGTWRDFSDPEVTFVSLTWKNSDGTNVSGDDKIIEQAFTYDSYSKCIYGVLNNNLSSGTHKTTVTVNVMLGSYSYSFTFNVVLKKE